MTAEQEKVKKSKKITTKRRKNYKKELKVVKKELETIKDQYLRILAEFDNYKKRMDRDFFNRVENAKIAFVEELLPIIDDFERSLNSIHIKKSSKSFRKGVELIYNKFKSILEKQGVECIEAIGKQFDPELHDALMQVDAKEQPSNIVVEEAVKGYKFKDKVIRHSKVIISK